MDASIAHNGAFFDLALDGADLASDHGLETAVVISLFSDRRADPGDELPDGTTERRGWWADPLADDDDTDRIGSKLWLLARAKQTAAVARRAEGYAREALQWMIDDGIARSVTAAAEWTARGVLGLRVRIVRPDGTPMTFTYNDLWEAMHAV